MRKIKLFTIVFLAFFIQVIPGLSQINNKINTGLPILSGPYFGQDPPGNTPVKFGDGIIDNDERIFAISFSADGKECFYTKSFNTNTIMTSKEVNGRWTAPAIAFFSGTHFDFEPLFTPDGNKLIFGSFRPLPSGGEIDLHQWFIERTENGWSEAAPMDLPFIENFVMYLTVANNGNAFFTYSENDIQGIYYSKYENNEYHTPVKLGNNINHLPNAAHPYIAHDESYIIFDAQPVDDSDLFISYRDQDGSWSRSISLGKDFNTGIDDLTPYVTIDGKYLFFSRLPDGNSGDIYWVDACIIDSLNPYSTSINQPVSTKPRQLCNYPNPFSENTNIIFEFDKPEIISINIINVNGIIIESLSDEQLFDLGPHTVNLNGNEYSNGIYYCVLQSNNTIIDKHKMLIIK